MLRHMTATGHVYRYARPSQLTRGADGGQTMLLATSGGSGPAGPLRSPLFFDGFIGHPAQAAAALRACARRALGHLGAAGQVGYDLADGSYFHRELPYDPAASEAMHPRLASARALVRDGAVTATAHGATVTSSGVTYQVSCGADGNSRCTCAWWGRHRGSRGPCKHVLAAALADLPR
jgi:hypothetical protein